MAFTERGTVSHEVERALRTIFKRCLSCPDETPTCPTCSNGQICSLVPQDCNTCAHMICVANPTPSAKSSGPNVGAIAGGVVGGIAFISIIVFLIWRFWIKKRRAQQEAEAEEWEEDDIAQQKSMHQFHQSYQDAASVRTRGSLANSFFSRASNIIQIAYIPGVTNRNGSAHNSFSAPPVPPIPAAPGRMPRSPLINQDDALFFRPGDLRGSTYSGTSSLGDRRDTQYTRQSITPSLARASVTSTIYGDNEPMPATQLQSIRAAPRMVSVRSTSTGTGSPAESPSLETPPGSSGKQVQVMMPGQGSSLRGKAQQVDLGSKNKGRFPVRQNSDSSVATLGKQHAPNVSSPLAGLDNDSDSEDEHARARQSLLNTLDQMASPPTIQPIESPFFDASERPGAAVQAAVGSRPNPYASMSKLVGSSREDKSKRGNRGIGGLSAVIEEATKRASRVPSHEGLGGKRESSPFGDEHIAE